MSLGLKRGSVKMEHYDPNWPREFEKEKKILLKTFEGQIVDVQHIGSTSVPGLPAKPIIDIIAAVKTFDNLDYLIDTLPTLGYEYMPDRMFDDRKFFPKGQAKCRTHHLNIVVIDNYEQWTQPLAFRDYLISHANVRNEYTVLKQNLALKYSKNRDSYTKAKNDFIKSVLAKTT